MSGIFVIQDDDNLVEMKEEPYSSEDLLQTLLAKYPNLLAGDQMNSAEPRRWLLIMREMGVPCEEEGSDRWSLDHLFLDQDAIPTLVEVKRSTDTRVRREVVGQMLDYAANAVAYWPVEQIQAKFEQRCERDQADPTDVLSDFLGADADPSNFWHRTKTNLQAGRIRMVFVADEIPVELRRIVEFLNEQTDPAEVLAVEIKQFVGEGMRSLVPRVLGQTVAAQEKKDGSYRDQKQWDEASFLAELKRREGDEVAAVAKQMLKWAEERQLRIWWGRGKKSGSFFPMYDNKHGQNHLFAAWTYGGVELQFQHMTRPPFQEIARRKELAAKLQEIQGVSFPDDTLSKRPVVPFSILTDDGNCQRFLDTFDWVLEEMKKQE